MKTLSISVAAYNMERLIRQNLDSFVNSDCADDIEVLVINDGSKDSTAEIVTEYAEKYPNTVKLINQENAGPGSTVNTGIKNATGKYFRMVDADDWVGEGFDTFVKTLKETDADMVVTNYICVDDKTNLTKKVKIQGLENGITQDFDRVCERLSLEMHSVTFKTEILKENNICLFNGFYTDIQYLLLPAPFVKTILYVDCDVYMYRVSLSGQSMAPESMQRNIKMHDDMLFSIVELYNNTRNKRIARYILNKLVMLTGTQLGTLLSFPPTKQNRENLYAFFSRLKSSCPEAYSKFSKYKTAIALNSFGKSLYPIICRLHRYRLGLK